MNDKQSVPDLTRLFPAKPTGSGGAPPAAPAGVPLPTGMRRPGRKAVRPPSIARFPGLAALPSQFECGGIVL
jgi:hypothetical protein